ncbi:vitelline membrane outer layer protein 1 homolog [Pseudorasbora parva]|uniref:vitelline membrane outer layer protein 1 homolog n=1 Tax=Pseudorasbora parva TaxID=51549 RepID=UPI00351F73A2
MHHFSIMLSLLAIIGQHVGVQTRDFSSWLLVLNGGPWGDWRSTNLCPDGTYAIGFNLRVEQPVGDGDDTALNGIRLLCADRSKGVLRDLFPTESHSGFWGDWTRDKFCPSGYLTAFQLRVEPYQRSGDDTAVNNVRFKCTDGTVLEGDGTSWGDWGEWSGTCGARRICGLSTKVERKQLGDDTALNDALMYCCN